MTTEVELRAGRDEIAASSDFTSLRTHSLRNPSKRMPLKLKLQENNRFLQDVPGEMQFSLQLFMSNESRESLNVPKHIIK